MVPVLTESLSSCANRLSVDESPERHKMLALVQSTIRARLGIWSGDLTGRGDGAEVGG